MLLQRYGEQIEADLALRGWDLAQLWHARRYRFLLNIIDHLPRDSYYTEAVAQDDELAELNSDEVTAAGDRKPPVSEFGPAEELLADIVDRLIVLNANLLAVNGNKPGQQHYAPRPETAATRLRRKKARDDVMDIITKFAPHELERLD